MASLVFQMNKLTANIDAIMDRRIESVKEIMSEEGRIMLSEFRQRQYASPHIPSPKKSKADTSEKIKKAIDYAKAHAGGPEKITKGSSWINRSFRAARGVHVYIDNNKTKGYIAVGMYHSMSYGAYLEFAKNRKFAVIEPIVRSRAVELLSKIKQEFKDQ
jgi:hypothetical protein